MSQPHKPLCKYWQDPAKCSSSDGCGRMHYGESKHITCRTWKAKGVCPWRDGGGSCAYGHPIPESFDNTVAMDGLVLADAVEIPLPKDGGTSTVQATIRERRDVASFSWIGEERKMIAVPGMPMRLVRRKVPMMLQPDHVDASKSSLNATGHRPWPRYPLEPTLAAIMFTDPSFRADDVHLITDHSSLRRLIDIASGAIRNVKIDVEIRADTLLLSRSRWEADQKRAADAEHRRGRRFAEASSRPLDGFESLGKHKHIVAYKLGSLQCLVQFPIDVFSCNHEHDTLVRDMTGITDRVAVQHPSAKTPVKERTENIDSLKVMNIGSTFRTECLLHTRSLDLRKKGFDCFSADQWLTGIARLLVGRYEHWSGRFVRVSEEDRTSQIAKWESANAELLGRFLVILESVRHAVLDCHKETGCKTFALHFEAKHWAMLKLYRRADGEPLIPDALAEDFWLSTSGKADGMELEPLIDL